MSCAPWIGTIELLIGKKGCFRKGKRSNFEVSNNKRVLIRESFSFSEYTRLA